MKVRAWFWKYLKENKNKNYFNKVNYDKKYQTWSFKQSQKSTKSHEGTFNKGALCNEVAVAGFPFLDERSSSG